MRLLLGSTGDDEHHFATRRIVDDALADFGDGSAADLLVILGQLAAQRHFAIRSEHVKQVGHGFVDAVQGFVEDDGATFRFERAQVLHTFAVLARQEAFVAQLVQFKTV